MLSVISWGTNVQKIQHQVRQRRAIPVNPGRPCVVAFTFHQSGPGFVALIQGQTSMAAQTAQLMKSEEVATHITIHTLPNIYLHIPNYVCTKP